MKHLFNSITMSITSRILICYQALIEIHVRLLRTVERSRYRVLFTFGLTLLLIVLVTACKSDH